MTEFCEGVQPPAVEEKEPRKDDKKPVNVRCMLFFDGTMNNKTNIASRETPNEFYKNSISKWSKIKYAVASTFNKNADKPKGGDSYENGYTNIVTLEKYALDTPSGDYQFVVKVYTEGAGTIDNEKDKTAGYAVGLGDAGVIKKCEKGIQKAANEIIVAKNSANESIDPETQYIKDLTIDVFGFSRGAATARYCIHKALKDEKWQIKKLLEQKQVETTEVRVWFAGLFDTVSSHGLSFSNDVRKLELDAVQHAAKTLHLVAGDECRKNFSITTIKSAGGKGEEYYLPGVHSDVGGSYLEFTDEAFDLNSGDPDPIRNDKKNLIDEGWYNKEEIEEYVNHDENGGEYRVWITANRKGISNAYCNIPLMLMAKGAENQKIQFDPQLNTDSEKAIETADKHFGNNDLSYLKTTISNYMPTTQAGYDLIKAVLLLKNIRHNYFHMSAKDEFGLKPRFKDGKRWRQDYGG